MKNTHCAPFSLAFLIALFSPRQSIAMCPIEFKFRGQNYHLEVEAGSKNYRLARIERHESTFTHLIMMASKSKDYAELIAFVDHLAHDLPTLEKARILLNREKQRLELYKKAHDDYKVKRDVLSKLYIKAGSSFALALAIGTYIVYQNEGIDEMIVNFRLGLMSFGVLGFTSFMERAQFYNQNIEETGIILEDMSSTIQSIDKIIEEIDKTLIKNVQFG